MPLVADVAEELLVVLVEGSRVQRLAARKTFDAASVVRFAIGGHHLEGKVVEASIFGLEGLRSVDSKYISAQQGTWTPQSSRSTVS